MHGTRLLWAVALFSGVVTINTLKRHKRRMHVEECEHKPPMRDAAEESSLNQTPIDCTASPTAKELTVASPPIEGTWAYYASSNVTQPIMSSCMIAPLSPPEIGRYRFQDEQIHLEIVIALGEDEWFKGPNVAVKLLDEDTMLLQVGNEGRVSEPIRARRWEAQRMAVLKDAADNRCLPSLPSLPSFLPEQSFSICELYLKDAISSLSDPDIRWAKSKAQHYLFPDQTPAGKKRPVPERENLLRLKIMDEAIVTYRLFDSLGRSLPEQYSGGAIPANPTKLLIYCHMNKESLYRFPSALRDLAGAFNAWYLVFEFPGYGCAGVTTVKTTRFALLVVLNWVRQIWGWNPADIILVGASIGTGMAVLGARVCNDAGFQVGGLILAAPYSSFQDLINSWTKNLLGKIAADSDDYDSVTDIQHIGNIPVFIAASSIDDIISLKYSEKVWNAIVPKQSSGSHNSSSTLRHFEKIDNVQHNDVLDKAVEPIRQWISRNQPHFDTRFSKVAPDSLLGRSRQFDLEHVVMDMCRPEFQCSNASENAVNLLKASRTLRRPNAKELAGVLASSSDAAT